MSAESLEQIKEILLALSMAFDNFLEFNEVTGRVTTSTNSNSTHSINSTTHISNTPTSPAKVIKFQRPARKPSPSNTEMIFNGRKRSWESDEQETAEIISETFTGKRSKSLVLTQELEGLKLSTGKPFNKAVDLIEKELSSWADQDFNINGNNAITILGMNDLKRELESCRSIDETLKVICTLKINSAINCNSGNYYVLNHWIKWTLINEVIELIKSPEISIKLLLNRSMTLLISLNRLTCFIDWNDLELSFLLNKFIIILLTSEKFKAPVERCSSSAILTCTSTRVLRGLEEFSGVLRILNLFHRFPLHFPDPSQSIQLVETLLETNLNIFELIASRRTDEFHNLAGTAVLVNLRILEGIIGKREQQVEEIKEIIFNVKSRIK